MMSRREANQRAAVNNCTIRRDPSSGEYEVYHNDWTRKERERAAYFTDDLEDAAITSGKLRRIL